MGKYRPPLAAGMILGSWLAWLFAFISTQANRVNLPGIPLIDPPGGFIAYYLGALGSGFLIGLICVWPRQWWLGGLVGIISGVVLNPISPWKPSLLPSSTMAPFLDLIFRQWIPLAVVLAPFVLLLLFSARQLSSTMDGYHPLLRIALPACATAMVIGVGLLGLFPPAVREAFSTTQKLVDEGLIVSHVDKLPLSLQAVKGFIPNATGRYTLEMSYAMDRFQGTQLRIGPSGENFLIVARFSNGFSLACNFAPGVPIPPCGSFR